LEVTYFSKKLPPDDELDTVLTEGIVISENAKTLAELFIQAIAQHRFWDREKPRRIPA
jgi:catalase